MREEERRETVTDVPSLGDPLAPAGEARDALIPKGDVRQPPKDERHPPKMPPPNPQVEKATAVTTTASSSDSPTTTVDLNLMKAEVPDTEAPKNTEPELPQFILAPAFMDIVCPECGALLQGASPTNLKNRQLRHPFGDPPLGGTPCRFKGRLFKTPVVRIDLL
jgi:hypothetical protein